MGVVGQELIPVEGYEEAMISKYKLDGDYLKDRFGNNYKIEIKENLMYIYNYKKRKLTTNYYKIGVNWTRFNKE